MTAKEQVEPYTPKKDSSFLDGDDGMFKKIKILTAAKSDSSHKAPTINDFGIIKPISRGAFGKVFLGFKHNDRDTLFAIKVMEKSEMVNKNMVSQVITERNALALSRSPYCVNLFYSLQSPANVYLVMEYMIGGDLKSLLAMYGYFDETAAKFYCAEVCLALQYLHQHGIVHRDIKPDNMLISSAGHVKLTDFGLSKIDMRRDLEMSDLINCSPNLNARTPGQLLSLTSHLSFGSSDKRSDGCITSNFMNTMNKHRSSDSEIDLTSEKQNDSHISGVSPFFSAEEINISITHTCSNSNVSSSYYTCNSSLSSAETFEKKNICGVLQNNNDIKTGKPCNGCAAEHYKLNTVTNKENKYRNHSIKPDYEYDACKYSFDTSMKMGTKETEDSGVSSRKSDFSHANCEISAIEKIENSCNSKEEISSDFSRSYNLSNPNDCSRSRSDCQSPFRNVSKKFKRPDCLRAFKRKRTLIGKGGDLTTSIDCDASTASTGLTQEIDLIDIGSSTPKKKKRKSPVKGVLKVRTLSDDEMPINENLGNVMFSTPVSSQKPPRRDGLLLGKFKNTRFNLPSSVEHKGKKDASSDRIRLSYLKLGDESVMSPINAGNIIATPKTVNTPFRTPKSVRRGEGRGSNERILGTPDYLAPELLLVQGHGPAVDWWALGVCLYEFMTGIPPFNDETPQKVFDNILHRNIEWPQNDEALSSEAVEAIELLLTMNPLTRPAAKEVQEMPFFKTIDWINMQEMEPPFVPSPDNPTDTGYFEARNVLQHIKLSSFDIENHCTN